MSNLKAYLCRNLQSFLELNELPYMAQVGIPCTFTPQYEYHQFSCIMYSDGNGFHTVYNLTTDEDLNDLTLQMDFLLMESSALTVKVLDMHVI